MKINYFYELKHYSKLKVEEIFGKELFKEIRDYLLVNRYCIENQETFQFDYVGVILIKNRIISILPKYLKSINFDTSTIKREYTELIVQVLKKYNKSSMDISDLYFNSEDKHLLYHKFSVIDYLLKDYYEYGIYENTVDILEENGFGEISWDDTIENETAYLSKNKPIYLNLWTHEVDSDISNYITLLHQFILNESISYLKSSEINKILKIMDVPELYFPVNEDVIGDIDYQLKMIDEELKTQFNDRKVNLLKSLKSFILNESFKSDIAFSMWGTGTFYEVWEKSCAEVLGNEYRPGNKYFKAINKNTKAYWVDIKKYSASMIPDIIFEKDNVTYLIDAKYYTKEGLKDMAIQDIAKQFLYLEGIREEIEGEYRNIFISPGIDGNFYSNVKLPLFLHEKIESIFLNAKDIFKCYTENKKMNKTILLDLVQNE